MSDTTQTTGQVPAEPDMADDEQAYAYQRSADATTAVVLVIFSDKNAVYDERPATNASLSHRTRSPCQALALSIWRMIAL